jgi:glycosyltransferase involved in cell wall biosynthesis
MSSQRISEPRVRVLLIAEACNSEWVSVPLEGWFHSQAIARLTDAHLVTHVRNRESLLRAGLREGQDFTAIGPTPVERSLRGVSRLLGLRVENNRGWTALTALSTLAYYSFERLVWREFGPRLRGGEFDVVHRLTPLSPATPSPIARRCRRSGVPFVVGPLNGGLPWPRGFGRVRVAEGEWLGFVRAAHRLLPGYWSMRANASAIIVGSRNAWSEVPARYREKAVYIAENAVDPDRFGGEVDEWAGLPLRVGFAGRLVPIKGVDMLLEAAAPLARAGRLCLDLVGDGPEMAALRALAEREGISPTVSFAGWVAHRQLQDRLRRCHVFAFPSIRDFGGGAVLEAMALGLVPIVVDYGGPGELVSPGTGFAVPLGRRDEIVLGLRRVLERLVADPSLIRGLGRQARARVRRSFTWSVKAAQAVEVYRFVLGRRERPDFGMPYPDPVESAS